MKAGGGLVSIMTTITRLKRPARYWGEEDPEAGI
jgi:hypothetical protein